MSARSGGVVIDASALPTVAFGRRSPMWWGILLFCVIEGTTLAALFFAYLYLRSNFLQWPPSGQMRALPGALCTATLLVSLVPMWLCRKRAMEMKLRPTRFWLLLTSLVSLVAVVFRVWEIASLPFPWTENAYASVVWTSFGFHAGEGVAGVLENVLITWLLYRGPVEKKHFEDVESNALFWAFVVLVWVPFAVLYLFDGAIR